LELMLCHDPGLTLGGDVNVPLSHTTRFEIPCYTPRLASHYRDHGRESHASLTCLCRRPHRLPPSSCLNLIQFPEAFTLTGLVLTAEDHRIVAVGNKNHTLDVRHLHRRRICGFGIERMFLHHRRRVQRLQKRLESRVHRCRVDWGPFKHRSGAPRRMKVPKRVHHLRSGFCSADRRLREDIELGVPALGGEGLPIAAGMIRRLRLRPGFEILSAGEGDIFFLYAIYTTSDFVDAPWWNDLIELER